MFSFITKYFQAFGTPVSTVILMELLSEFARYGSKYDLTETERKLFEFLLTEASRMVKNFNNFFNDKYGFSLIKNMNDEKRSVMFWFVALFYYVNISMQMLPNDPVDMMLRIESAAEFHGLLEFLNDWLENKKLLYPS